MKKDFMQKRYTLTKYQLAVEKLAIHHSVEAHLYHKSGRAYMFKIMLKGGNDSIETWTFTTTGGEDGYISSQEYLRKPAVHINHATQEEFDSIIESL